MTLRTTTILALLAACSGQDDKGGVDRDPASKVAPDWLASGGGLGQAIAVADFNGDGRQDVAALGTDAEVVNVYLGRRVGLPTTPDAEIQPIGAGMALAAVDLDADGFDELLITQNDGSQGTVTIIPGSASGPDSASAQTLSGAGLGASFGASLASAGDIDNDGLEDFVVGARADRQIHVYLGATARSTGLPARTITKSADADYGKAVAGVGDLDGDGFDDIAVSAPGANGGRGYVWAIFGTATGPGADVRIEGILGGGRLGASIAPVGDTDGDGRVELAISRGDGTGVELYQHDARVFTRTTELEVNAREVTGLGYDLAGIDWNDDGYGDVAVGTPGTGLVALYMGRASGIWGVNPDGAIEGPRAGTDFGSSVAAMAMADPPDALVIGYPSGLDGAGAVGLWRGVLDFDNDGVWDSTETAWGLDPLNPDTDGDGLSDGQEFGHDGVADTDGDGIIDALDLDSDADTVPDRDDNCPIVVNPEQFDSNRNGIGDECDYEPGRCNPLDPSLEDVIVDDIGDLTGFDDLHFGHRKRGRALVSVDFDFNGIPDFYFGNPGDESYVVKGVDDGYGGVRYEFVQLLAPADEVAFGGAAADYDNDGDYDLFMAMGGPACPTHDYLYKNMFMETGVLSFVDVSAEAGIQGRDRPDGLPMRQPATNAAWIDVDRDGDQDVFVSNYAREDEGKCGLIRAPQGRNNMWLNNGDGTFTDVTKAVGLNLTQSTTKHSTWIDYDNDGDYDLYENNFDNPNVMWHNDLVETGTLFFRDVTAALSAGGDNISQPIRSFASCSDDFDNDGTMDLIAFHRGGKDCQSLLPDESTARNALFMNRGGTHFENKAFDWDLNNTSVFDGVGVMGCQIGDLNGDGWIDVFVGNGGPSAGEPNQLYLWGPDEGRFLDASVLIDFPAPGDDLAGPAAVGPAYPYRTHGTAFIDIDNDGRLEMAVNNGGGEAWPNYVREANRMFTFDWGTPVRYLKVRPVGDGVNVSRDGIGTRMVLTTRLPDGTTQELHRHLPGGSCFSAQMGFDVYFGLSRAASIESLEVLWSDGTRTLVDPVPSMNSSVVVTY